MVVVYSSGDMMALQPLWSSHTELPRWQWGAGATMGG